MLWFKLESSVFKSMYWTEYYAYPKYDLPVSNFCIWWAESLDITEKTWGWCYDANKKAFIRTISNPCKY